MSSPKVRAVLFGFQDSPLLNEINALSATLKSIGWAVNMFLLSSTDYRKANEAVEYALGNHLPDDNSFDTLFVYYGGYALDHSADPSNACASLKWHASPNNVLCHEHVLGVRPFSAFTESLLPKCEHVVIMLQCPFNKDTYPDWPNKNFRKDHAQEVDMQVIVLPAPATEVKLGRTAFDCTAKGCQTRKVIEVPDTFSGLPTTRIGDVIGDWSEREDLTVRKLVEELGFTEGRGLGVMGGTASLISLKERPEHFVLRKGTGR